MEDPRELHRRAGTMAEGVIAQIPAERLGDPTPCAEWDVRAVINHMANGNLRFAALISGKPGPDRGEDVLGDDPLAAFRDTFDRACTASDRTDVLEQTLPTPLGEGTGALLVTIRAGDLAVHAWDLAAATGQPRDLDPELVAFIDKTVRSLAVPRGEQSPFGTEQPAPAGATAADRLAAYLGRKVPAPGA